MKDFKCDHCEYATTRRSDLERHVSGIHFRYGRYTQAAAQAQTQVQVQPANQTNHVIDVKPVQQIQVHQIPTLPSQSSLPTLPTQPVPPSQISVSVQHHSNQPPPHQTQQQPYHVYQQRLP